MNNTNITIKKSRAPYRTNIIFLCIFFPALLISFWLLFSSLAEGKELLREWAFIAVFGFICIYFGVKLFAAVLKVNKIKKFVAGAQTAKAKIIEINHIPSALRAAKHAVIVNFNKGTRGKTEFLFSADEVTKFKQRGVLIAFEKDNENIIIIECL